MNIESLKEIRYLCVDVIKDANINDVDKCELLMNIWKFLNPKEYDNNIKVLRREQDAKKGFYSRDN